MLLFPRGNYDLYLYDFLFEDMVSGVQGHGCNSRLEALPWPAWFILELL